MTEWRQETIEKRREDAMVKHFERLNNKKQGRDKTNYLDKHVRKVMLLEVFRGFRRTHKWSMLLYLNQWKHSHALAGQRVAFQSQMRAHAAAHLEDHPRDGQDRPDRAAVGAGPRRPLRRHRPRAAAGRGRLLRCELTWRSRREDGPNVWPKATAQSNNVCA